MEESGSGKSVTSLAILGLLNKKQAEIEGSITYFKQVSEQENQEIDLLHLDEDGYRKERGNNFSMIFQEPMTSLNPVYTCGDQVAERPFSHLYTPTQPGTYTIRARAVDRENLRTDASVTITVSEANLPPIASFVTPTVSTLGEGYSELVVTVDASDPNGDEMTVGLKINGEEIRMESIAPYEWGHSRSPNSQETVGLTEGEHVFEAVLTDSKGAVTTIEKIITVTRSVVTSSNDKLDVNNLTAFPNPSETGVFTLSYSTDFEVHSINGGQLLTGNGDKIDLSSYPKGVYFLKVNQKVIQLVR